jgi:primosomal protein N' (replication factor Y) (superfamily II helicase)
VNNERHQGPQPTRRIVRVLTDEAAIGKTFDYFITPDMPGYDLIRVGTEVRIELHGRRVGGWVVADDVEPPEGVTVRPLAKVRGFGPPEPVVDLAHWVAWRWGGRPAQVMRFASPPQAVRRLPLPPKVIPTIARPTDPLALLLERAARITEATPGVVTVATPPSMDRTGLILGAIRIGGDQGALIIAPSIHSAQVLGRRLRRAGVPVAVLPDDWAVAAAGGCTVIGARASVFAPIPNPGIIMVLDEHDESHQDERTPTWHARDVAIERVAACQSRRSIYRRTGPCWISKRAANRTAPQRYPSRVRPEPNGSSQTAGLCDVSSTRKL